MPELTGLRGLAALMVFVSHLSKDGLIPAFFARYYSIQGVILFFMLSGFLMGQLYLDKQFTNKNLHGYIKARIARIFPLYFLILLTSFLISNYIYTGFYYDFRNQVKFITGLFFLGAPYELWTVPIEVQFYGCFILFWYFYAKEKRNKLTHLSLKRKLNKNESLAKMFKDALKNIKNPCATTLFDSNDKIVSFSMYPREGTWKKMKTTICIPNNNI
ncbi:MAG TPA: acyltransferase [Bacteroidia bacterium]|nr:acyltransferase [Bacteroidia bacterium]